MDSGVIGDGKDIFASFGKSTESNSSGNAYENVKSLFSGFNQSADQNLANTVQSDPFATFQAQNMNLNDSGANFQCNFVSTNDNNPKSD